MRPLAIIAGISVPLLVLGSLNLLSVNLMRYLMQICLYIALGEAWNLMSGFTGMTSLGQQLYIGLTGYTIAVMTSIYELPFYAGMAAGFVICGLVSFLLSFVLFRMDGMYFSIASWVAAEAACLIFLNWDFINSGAGMIISIAPYPTTRHIFMWSLVLSGLCIAVIYVLMRSKAGLAIMAMRDDPDAALSVGISISRYKLLTYVCSALIASLAGGMFFINKGVIYPDSGFHSSWTISTVFIVIIGGSGTIAGPIVGSALYVILNEYLAHLPGWSNIILGIITIIVVLFWPEGIVGTLQSRLQIEFFPLRRLPEPIVPTKKKPV